jgi:hypothetical protein
MSVFEIAYPAQMRNHFGQSCVRSCDPNCGRNRDVDYHNRFSEANESQGRRQRLCGNESDRSLGRRGMSVSLARVGERVLAIRTLL